MKPLQRLAFIGNHLPRLCGIATFTHDLNQAVATARPDLDTCVVAMNDPGQDYDYPPSTRFRIVELLSRLSIPVVTTLHTVLAEPTPEQRRVLDRIIDVSARVVVMSDKAREFLRSVHGTPDHKINIIPHGIPDFQFRDTYHAKVKLGFTGKMVVLTFGLLSPNKGIETMLDAMPGIIRSCPNAIYVVVGATHPKLVRDQGETYRDSLAARVHDLGIQDHVVFFNQFVDQTTLLNFISACDVYVTPYLNEAQITSGTLAYSFGLGSAIVSTPYWHAKELLRDGLGVLVPFGDAEAFSAQVGDLLTNDVRRHSMRRRAYAASRSMIWPETAKRYIAVFNAACDGVGAGKPATTHRLELPTATSVLPDIRLEHFLSLCDSTGLLQHGIYTLPDRLHGYCLDDNARALLLACSLGGPGEPRLPEGLSTRFAAFIHHAWNPDSGRFRNFMSYDRRWLEDMGSEDSHGRALWALGECARTDRDLARRMWAGSLFRHALPAAEAFTSPRAWAFTLLGLDAWCQASGSASDAPRLREILAERLASAFRATGTADWAWFEDVLAYDNARLPQALIQTGMTSGTRRYVEAGIRTLEWLMAQQTAPAGHFRPVGTDSFGNIRQSPRPFDQQPVEAAATISACLAALRADGNAVWRERAMVALRWFQGDNDLGVSLIDDRTGGCADGLHPDRRNENMGAESVLSYMLGLLELQCLAHADPVVEPVPQRPRLIVSAGRPRFEAPAARG
jgi:glycosyltransferase involved in cell wall biosynthesis